MESRIRKDLDSYGIRNVSHIHWNLSTPALYEEIVKRREGVIAHLGPVVVRTGHYTGRSPDDKFIVREPSSESKIWWGDVNRSFEQKQFDLLLHRLQAYLQGKDIFVQDCYAGAHPSHRVPIRVITETAWHNLFSRNMFVQLKGRDMLKTHTPKFIIINAPNFWAVPELDGTNSEAFVLVDFGKKIILVGGTSYAGEIKKSVFTILNYLLPQKKILSMHCSANVGPNNDVAIFFGLSGTGKTTLSADPERRLIGDDEHGWGDDGVFNFEGGCYAKVIRLSKEHEPEIYECTRKFGTILENVGFDIQSRRIDLDDASLTENTRAAYPIPHIPNAIREGRGGQPSNIIMLTADAFGVLPPISKLTPEQAMFHFLSGYTAKVAGTERGVTEPQATFSACFGAPFMALHPTVYAKLLGEKIKENNVTCWLINTGWSGGMYGVGKRIHLPYTRAMVKSALNGTLASVETREDPIFKLLVPLKCEGVPDEILNPRSTWENGDAYDEKARELVGRFKENFRKFEDKADATIKACIPA